MEKQTNTPFLLVATLDELEQLLEHPELKTKHLYCRFQKETLQHHHLIALKKRRVQSVTFTSPYTIYPSSVLTQLKGFDN
ncbi:hypothetical protein [Vibrio harveyi]|uniref:hypothetical protein n=1 Tax=Vibrio harveyi TaxID=669 RepID=UPI000CE5458E|nr:hypothetical protein [Vibrio harveyi]WJT10959.1 hypothetical protein PH545_28135 [Vibrio harveyi]HDM8209322.1 hypothetical protein [Vibrio campbellii]HDM8219933.1 hypothetical protein [Vibrio campbellii]